MGKLTENDITAIKEKYLRGQTSDFIAKQFGISGQRVRQMIKQNGWKELRNSNGLVSAPNVALLKAKDDQNFWKDTPITREFVLDELARGASPTAAARRVGIDHKTLSAWRAKDPEFDIQCKERQADFIAGLESLAADVSTPKDALNLLSRHPLTKNEWAPSEDKTTIKIEYSFTREDKNVIDADFKEVKQIEG